MEVTREIYWNIGSGALTLIPMYLLTCLSLALLSWGFWRRIKIYRQGRKLERTNNLLSRGFKAAGLVLTQAKVMRVPGAGSAHSLFFWAFFVLFIGTCLIVVQADFSAPLFGVTFLKGNFYRLFSLVLDIAGAVAILMLAGLIVRRYLLRPKGLETRKDDALIHGLLMAILLTGFVIEGARMAVTELGTELSLWSPVGLLFAKALSGIDESGQRSLHIALWWVHLLLALALIALIPFSKLRHIFTTSSNYFFADHGPKGKLVTLDMEDEQAESFGAAKVSDLTWKDIFDTDACTRCKRCQDRCPAFNTEKPLSPMKIINQIGDIAFAADDPGLVSTLGRDELWSCTTCRACQEICPADIEHVSKIIEVRRNLVLMEGEFPGNEVVVAVNNTEVNGNPLGLAFASRGEWAASLGINVLSEDPEVDILYFVGCYASFDKRNNKVANSFVEICKAAGVKVGILGSEEKCCGEPVRKIGNEYVYQKLANENIKNIIKYNIKEIVTTCPHCYDALSKDYKDLGLDVKVKHYTVFINDLLKYGKIKIRPNSFECTYHDSCYIGRHNDIYQPPRNLISLAGGQLVEMKNNFSDSFCCGAGGGRILSEEKLGTRICEKRINMAVETGAPILVSNCPFCLTMFEDGIKGAGVDERLVSRDIAELLVERLFVQK